MGLRAKTCQIHGEHKSTISAKTGFQTLSEDCAAASGATRAVYAPIERGDSEFSKSFGFLRIRPLFAEL